MVGSESRKYPAPTCIDEYNKNMQGVDRLDPIRGRFSIADGHSFKRCHKQLALAMIDIARANAYLTRRLAKPDPLAWDPYRQFVTELASELMNGKWTEAPTDGRLMYGQQSGDANTMEAPLMSTSFQSRDEGSPTRKCSAVASKQIYDKKSRKRRRCIICRWEERYPTELTTYCLIHGVCPCREVHSHAPTAWMCPRDSWTCWDKFHLFHLPNKLCTGKLYPFTAG
ncbi:unnamed protein product [Phytophthora fragariaefolia]|uniref:Unnamed protein product n=1 Tax=Phytophthora fragariaefolia TaxID=1490495 RepID=A0A9W6YIS1_9STRA|nr:unnamed protein product [Phytophthora fragariaefolia]